MKHSLRNLVAAAAAQEVVGESVHELIDCTHERVLAMDHVLAAERSIQDARLVLTSNDDEHVSLTVHGDMFHGWDLQSGHYFSGAVHESDLLLFDGQEGCYYRYVLH